MAAEAERGPGTNATPALNDQVFGQLQVVVDVRHGVDHPFTDGNT